MYHILLNWVLVKQITRDTFIVYHSLYNIQQSKSRLEVLPCVREHEKNKVSLYFPFLLLSPSSRINNYDSDTNSNMVGREVPTLTKQFIPNWVSYNSTPFSYCLEIASDPQVKGSVPQDCSSQLQMLIVTCASVWPQIGISKYPLLGFNLFAGEAHRTHGDILFTRLPVYYKKI